MEAIYIRLRIFTVLFISAFSAVTYKIYQVRRSYEAKDVQGTVTGSTMMVPRMSDGLCLRCYGKFLYEDYLGPERGNVVVICECQKERVRFIQYLRPDGRKKEMFIEARPPEIVAKSIKIWTAGYRLESEMLVTGLVYLTISDGEEDLASELVPNGLEVPLAVDRMISGFALEKTK